jgi:hypothetical protein
MAKKRWIQQAVKPKNVGKFTDHCKREGAKGVTEACIQKGMHSKNLKTRREANFANNMRKINH